MTNMKLSNQFSTIKLDVKRSALRGPLIPSLNNSEQLLLEEIGNTPEGVSLKSISDKGSLSTLLQKGFLEHYPGGKIRSLGVYASRISKHRNI